ncbi:hypothetical protein H3005_09585 [Stenotrophomonas sp. Br8]|uniref:hypothetical protein n=1 Tax=Stenotrophomonas sp. Br8 TaxID=2759658 RepID=UPI00168A44A3|nr:hypothetical protein [Stenotrophomonas sp. Br8]MBD3682116.1 hypothetical protein [Stenotrophomonas sp. Br8]
MDSLLLLSEAGNGKQVAALRCSNLRLIRRFVMRGPAGRGQFGACLGDEGRFLGALGGGMIKPIQYHDTPIQYHETMRAQPMEKPTTAPSSAKARRGSVMPESPHAQNRRRGAQ